MSTPDPPTHPHNDDEVEPFPYLCLLNEMKEAILKNIHDPQDKLNILKALPVHLDTQGLMRWDYTSLQFELVYPFIFQYLKSPDESGSWKNVLNLCKVSPRFQKVVTNHFEKYITLPQNYCTENTFFREHLQKPILTFDILPDILEAASDETSPPWLTTIPFVIATSIHKRSQVPFLTKLKKKVWSLGLSLFDAYNDPGAIDYFVECLRLVPDLRRLNVADMHPPDNMPPEVLDEKHLALPELPDLKMISLMKDCDKFQKWILPKYSRQLEVMDFEDCYLNENFNPTCFPKMEEIQIKFTLNEEGQYWKASIDEVNDLMNKFLLSPLKVITVLLNKLDVAKFFNFMLTLNTFGNTLHTLEMKFGHMNDEMGDEVKNSLRGWISELKLPRLSCLELDCYVGPLEFLLSIKTSLRKLSIVTDSLTPIKVSKVNGLKFTVEQEGMLESSIWDLFPVLEWLRMDYKLYSTGLMEGCTVVMDQNEQILEYYFPCVYTITRQMYERHQKNLRKIESDNCIECKTNLLNQ